MAKSIDSNYLFKIKYETNVWPFYYDSWSSISRKAAIQRIYPAYGLVKKYPISNKGAKTWKKPKTTNGSVENS